MITVCKPSNPRTNVLLQCVFWINVALQCLQLVLNVGGPAKRYTNTLTVNVFFLFFLDRVQTGQVDKSAKR